MTLTDKQLRPLAKELINREKEFVYGEAHSEDERIAAIEKFLVEWEKKLGGDDPKKTNG